MIISDIDQRRILVDSTEMLNHVMRIGEGSGHLCEYRKVKDKLWLVTITKTTVGDYCRRNRMKEELVGIARLDIKDIEELEIKCE